MDDLEEAFTIDPDDIDNGVMEKISEVRDNRALRPPDGHVIGNLFIEEL